MFFMTFNLDIFPSIFQGFAQTMGEFIMIFHCTKQQDPMSLGRAIQGLALVSVV